MMSMALMIVGVVAIIISIIVGLSTGAFFGFIISLMAGVCIAMILVAFAQMIENQLKILYQLEIHNEFTRHLHKKYKKCPNCGYEYEDTLTSCPHCGSRKS